MPKPHRNMKERPPRVVYSPISRHQRNLENITTFSFKIRERFPPCKCPPGSQVLRNLQSHKIGHRPQLVSVNSEQHCSALAPLTSARQVFAVEACPVLRCPAAAWPLPAQNNSNSLQKLPNVPRGKIAPQWIQV